MILKQSLPLLFLLLCLVSVIFQDSPMNAAGTTAQKLPVEVSSNTDPRYAKMANAVLNLHKRIQALENKVAMQEGQIAQLNNIISALRQDISALRADENFDRSAIRKLHERLNYVDSKSGSIVFPDEE